MSTVKSEAELRSTTCAICDIEGHARELYPASFGDESLTAAVFSARRLPDRAHHRLVQCERCGLVRSDPVLTEDLQERLYAASAFTYGDQVDNLNRTYGRYLARLRRNAGRQESLLEVGCGNGFFLVEALRQGYSRVAGVEPSSAAIAAADPTVGPHIVCDMMRPGLFEPGSFDAVCFLQVLDHLPHPADALSETVRLLRPGGRVLCLNHNVSAVSARLMGERSPIFDIEHTYLYSPETIGRLFHKLGLEPVEMGSVVNRYDLGYLLHLLPAPAALKRRVLATVGASPVRNMPLAVPLGNLYAIGRRPD